MKIFYSVTWGVAVIRKEFTIASTNVVKRITELPLCINGARFNKKWREVKEYTSLAAIPGYGVEPSVTISHKRIPKLHTSVLAEKMLSYRLSGAIQRMGKRPSDFRS